MNSILCDCGHESKPTDFTTGYAQTIQGKTICFDCCADLDRGHMLLDGNSKRLPLYLVKKDSGEWRVSNWPGTLSFYVMGQRKGTHNIGRTRHDVWFVGPDAHVWHGVQIGEWNTICHAKRTREVWKQAAK